MPPHWKLLHQKSRAPLLHQGNKVGNGAVVATLHIVREVAGRELSLFTMVSHTLAAVTLARAWIGAVTAFEVLSILALHISTVIVLQSYREFESRGNLPTFRLVVSLHQPLRWSCLSLQRWF